MIDLDLSALKQRPKFAAFTFGSLVTKDSLYFCESEEKDSHCSGMFQRCIRMSRSCFGISSRYLRVLWFILSEARNNYEEVLLLEEIKN